MTSSGCDVVVIGAGHNGLVAANYLADAGLAVTVVEAASGIGGMTSSSAGIAGAPEHVVNHCAVDLLFWAAHRPSRELGLDRYGLRLIPVDPPIAYLHPDGSSLAFWRDPRRTADEIAAFSRRDAAQYLEFSRLVDAMVSVGLPISATSPTRPEAAALLRSGGALARHWRHVPKLFDLALTPAAEMIEERFTHPVVRAALHCFGALVTAPANATSAMAFLVLGFLQRVPCYRPEGGMQALPDALAARLQSRGGRILTGAPVTGIDVEAGRACGVQLAEGAGSIKARVGVLATCDPRQALVSLLPNGTLSQSDTTRAQAIATKAGGHGMFKIDLALSGRVALPRHQAARRDGLDLRVPSHLIGLPEGIRRSYGASTADLVPEPDDVSFWNALPVAADPSQAPPGGDVAYIWTTQVPLEPLGGWSPVLDKFAAGVLDRLQQYYRGLAEFEIGRRVTTSADVALDCRVSDGNITHVDMALHRLGPRRPAPGFGGYRTPLPGLFLGGAGTHPGGGVGGAAGHLAAQAVLRSIKRR